MVDELLCKYLTPNANDITYTQGKKLYVGVCVQKTTLQLLDGEFRGHIFGPDVITNFEIKIYILVSRRNEWRRGFFHKLMERVLCRPHPVGEPCVIRMWRSRLVWLWVITCVKWHNFGCSLLIGPYYDEHVFSEGVPPACGAVFADCRVKRMWRKN